MLEALHNRFCIGLADWICARAIFFSSVPRPSQTRRRWVNENIASPFMCGLNALSTIFQKGVEHSAMGKSIMAGTGGFRKGAGRKSNASRLVEAGFVASWFTSDFQEIKWKSFLESDDERIALDATKYLTDRLFGKAPQSVVLEHSGAVNLGLAEQIKKARERVAQSRSRL
jgi:hypothetical protein